MKKLCLLIVLIISVRIYGQKPPLDHEFYDDWKSINQSLNSNNGEGTVFTVNPQPGDGWLYIFNNITRNINGYNLVIGN
jgi:hypothetical protein